MYLNTYSYINTAKLNSLTSGNSSRKNSQKNNSDPKLKTNKQILNESHSESKVLIETVQTLQNEGVEIDEMIRRNMTGNFSFFYKKNFLFFSFKNLIVLNQEFFQICIKL
jgi:hypothetical protein